MISQSAAKRVVHTREYVGVLKGLVEDGHEVSMTISGSSMSPFLCHHRDIIFFRRPDRQLRAGDMVFYQRDGGQYVMHRIVKKRKDGCYDIIGDGQLEIERGVRPEQIFAIITKVRRKGREIVPGDFWWGFFAHVWRRMIPLRRIVLKLYAVMKKRE